MDQQQVKDYTLRISQANSSELMCIIFDIYFDSIDCAKEAFKSGDKDQIVLHLKKAERCVGEMIHSLDYKDPLASVAGGFMINAHKYLIDARIRLDEHLMLQSENLIRLIHPTFKRIASEDTEPALMNNTQSVYAGLTYGRAGLNELAVDPKKNRGFQI